MKQYILHILFIATIPCLLFGQAKTAVDTAHTDLKNSYAIIIGISDYQNPDIADLDYAAADAKSIQSLLTEQYGFREDQTYLLMNEAATLQKIRETLGLLYSVAENSRVLIFYAGHGETIQLKTGGDIGFLVPYDGDMSDQTKLYSTCLPMAEISSLSGYFPSRHVLFMVDACYGGLAAQMPRSSLASAVYYDKMMRLPARQIITAGGKGEKVIELSRIGHSIFTKALLDGLGKGYADLDQDGIIPTSELYSYLRKQVTNYSHNQQTPLLRNFTSDEGEFIFFMNQPALPDLIGDLIVNSNLDGLPIVINDKETNYRTPALIKGLRAGKKKVSLLYNENLLDWEIDLKADQKNIHTFNVDFCKLTIESNVTGAEIEINGHPVHTHTPATIDSLAEGVYSIALKYGPQIIGRKVCVLNQQNNKIRIDFPTGNIHVNSNVKGARIWLDDILLPEIAPAQIVSVLPGTHEIKVQYLNTTLSRTIVVSSGETATEDFVFEQQTSSKSKTWYYVLGGCVIGGVTAAILLRDSKSKEPAIPDPGDFFPTGQ